MTFDQSQTANLGRLHDPRACRSLVEQLTPVIRRSVTRALVRAGALSCRGSIQPDVADLTQDVLARLFAHDARALAEFSPSFGLSLSTYVALIAQRVVISRLRSPARSPLTEFPTAAEALEEMCPSAPHRESELVTRDMLERLLPELRAQLGPNGARVLDAMQDEDVAPACLSRELGISVEAVYTWRHRIRLLGRRLADDLEQEGRLKALPVRGKRPSPKRVRALRAAVVERASERVRALSA